MTDRDAATASRALDRSMPQSPDVFQRHGWHLANSGNKMKASTDCIASTPIYVVNKDKSPALVCANQLDANHHCDNLDRGAFDQLAMGGYTIGRATLLAHVTSLKPGETVEIVDGKMRHDRWMIFVPNPIEPEASDAPDDVAQEIMAAVGRMIDSFKSADPTIMLPLSAGLDSRAIVSALAERGYKKVHCFSYGLPGNHEANAARLIAKHLGYRWTFVPLTHQSQRQFFGSELFARFCQFAARPDAMPFVQDVSALEALRANEEIPEDAVFVNGQSGDYLTGNHIPPELSDPYLNGPAGADAAFAATISKHFDLWRSLKTDERLTSLRHAWEEDLRERLGAGWLDYPAYVLFELSEYDNRQSKYVVAGQRAYEFFGLDWRLPLWDAKFVIFWKQMPLKGRLKQIAYKRALQHANWGGVWGNDWNFGRHIVPKWIRPIRMATKIASAPLGKQTWHAIDKRVFAWWIDPVQNYQIVPWRRTLTDGEGFRNGLSFHAEAYLKRQGWKV